MSKMLSSEHSAERARQQRALESAEKHSQVNASRRRLTRIYLFALGLVALFALTAYLGIYQFTMLQKNHASIIALSGRQRMLAQSIGLLSLRLIHSNDPAARGAIRQSLGDAIRLMEESHEKLIKSSPQTGFFNEPAQTLQAIYFAPPTPLDQQARNFLAKAKSLMDSPDSALVADNPDLTYVLTAAQSDFANSLDNVVKQYEAADTLAIVRLQQIELIALGLILATLAIESLYIFRPMVRHVERDTRKLVDSQNLLDAVLDTVGEAIVTVDLNNVIVRVNQEVQSIWGYTQQELIGEKFQELLAPSFRGSHHDASDIRNLNKRVELEGLKQDGTVFPLEMRITKTMTDDAVLFTSAMRDITEAKRAEGQIRHQLDTLKALYDHSQKLTESLDLNHLAADITRTCVKEFGARLAWLGRAEFDGHVRPFAQYPTDSDYPQQITVRWDNPNDPMAQGPSGRAIRTREPVVSADLTSDPSFDPWREAALAQGFRSAAAFPLISGDRPFGSLQLHSEQTDFFTPERIEFFQSYAHQAAAALENARLLAEDRRRIERMQALRAVDMAITSSLDLRATLNVLLDQVISHLGTDAAVVLLLNPHSQTLEHVAERGFRYTNIVRSRLRLGQGLAGRAALERSSLNVPNLTETEEDAPRAALLVGEGFVAYYAVPLIAKGQVKGVLEIFQRASLATDPEWLNFLEALAAQAAIAIDNAALFEGLQRSNTELALAYDDTLEGWSTALDLRDKETEGHTVRVTTLAVRLARMRGLGNDELMQLHRGGLLHDIGKMGIPDHILLKNGPLTDEEWAIMRMHPLYAYEMLSPIAFLRPALDIPYCHHEKWDGTGYPRGLKGKQIPLAARIFSVIDVWDALRSDRPYRKGWPEEKVREYIKALSATHFDPEIVHAFLDMTANTDALIISADDLDWTRIKMEGR